MVVTVTCAHVGRRLAVGSPAVARVVEPRWLSRESAYFLRAVYNSRIAPFKTDSADLCRHSWDPRLGDPRAGRAQRLGSRDGGVVFAKRVSGFLFDGREGARSQVRSLELGKSHISARRTPTSRDVGKTGAGSSRAKNVVSFLRVYLGRGAVSFGLGDGR